MLNKPKILLLNANHCRLAQCLLMQTAAEEGADIVLITEPLFNPGDWTYNDKGTTAIWTTKFNGLQKYEDNDHVEENFVSISIKGFTIICIYLSPSISQSEYAVEMRKVADFIKKEKARGMKIVLGGDFNAYSPAWGSSSQSRRGTTVLQTLWEEDVHPVRPWGGPTFERAS